VVSCDLRERMCRLGNSPIRKRPSDEMSGRSLHLQKLVSIGLIPGNQNMLTEVPKAIHSLFSEE
jgi:hypothetical protein